MKAIIDRPASTVAEGIEQLHVILHPPTTPQLEPNQVLLTMHATCINYPDLLMLADGYQHKATFPFTPGLEYAGKITAIGVGVTNFKIGDRVMGNGNGLSSHITVNSNAITTIPNNLSYIQAASFWVGFTTAYHCLIERGNLQKGEWLLVNGGTGGMGMAAILLAKQIGAHVICTGGTDEKLNQVSSFAKVPRSQCINYRTNEKYAKLVKACTPNGRGVDVVFDPVGGEAGMEALRSTSWGARILIVGFTSGIRQEIAANYVLIKGLTIMGCRAGEYIRRTPNGMEKVGIPRKQMLMKMAAKGLVPCVSGEYPFTTVGVRNCFRDIFERRIVGRACVVVPDDSKL